MLPFDRVAGAIFKLTVKQKLNIMSTHIKTNTRLNLEKLFEVASTANLSLVVFNEGNRVIGVIACQRSVNYLQQAMDRIIKEEHPDEDILTIFAEIRDMGVEFKVVVHGDEGEYTDTLRGELSPSY